MNSIKTINDGAKVIFDEAIDLLSDDLDKVVIIGGWGPFLRNSSIHPGTKDVDVLFSFDYTKEEVGKVIMRFLDKGYMVSAKHGFQILKPVQVLERRYLYNIDFLHPAIERDNIVELHDVINLDVTIDGFIVKTVQTAGILRGDLVFDENLYEPRDINGAKVNLLNDTGVIITKIKSCCTPKRPRDIYDVILAWNADTETLKSRLAEMIRRYEIVKTWFKDFSAFGSKNPDFFPDGIYQFSHPDNAQANLSALKDILDFSKKF